MRKFQVGDVVQIVNHQRLPWRLNRYRDSSYVEFIEIIGFSDREYRICIHMNSGSERIEWAVPAFLEKAKVEEPFTFEEELMTLLGGAAV
jgi:hypothetical protein